jgi:hypothetical protein
MLCPTCGEHLGRIQVIYEEDMKKLAESFGVDDEAISKGIIDNDDKYKEGRKKIIKKLVDNPCCSSRLMNYIDIVKIIKG